MRDMIIENEKAKLREQLEEALTWYSKYEDSLKNEIMVDRCVYDKAEKMSKMLDTDIEGILTFAACRILKERDLL